MPQSGHSLTGSIVQEFHGDEAISVEPRRLSKGWGNSSNSRESNMKWMDHWMIILSMKVDELWMDSHMIWDESFSIDEYDSNNQATAGHERTNGMLELPNNTIINSMEQT